MLSFLPVTLVAAILAVFALAVVRKHRQTWGEIFRIRKELETLRSELLGVRKDLVLSQTGESLRLPPGMPSQNGEDLVLWDFFGRKRDGFYVEVGAYDGIGFSNTYFFEAIGWSGVLVEASPDLYVKCVASRPHSTVVHAACGDGKESSVTFTVAAGSLGVDALSSMKPDTARIVREGGSLRTVDVPSRTLDDILGQVTHPIDFVSVDVEGAELEVFSAFDLERFRPRVLVVEDNSGGADPRVPYLLAQKGYRPSFQIEQNIFYTRVEESQSFGL